MVSMTCMFEGSSRIAPNTPRVTHVSLPGLVHPQHHFRRSHLKEQQICVF